MVYFLILGLFPISCDKYLLEMCFATIAMVGVRNIGIYDIDNPSLKECITTKIFLLSQNMIGIFF